MQLDTGLGYPGILFCVPGDTSLAGSLLGPTPGGLFLTPGVSWSPAR